MITPTEFVERMVASAAELALFFVGESEANMIAALSQTRENLATKLSDQFGAEIGVAIADRFVAAVADHKRELEGAGSPPVLN
jgi:hypothetical protein